MTKEELKARTKKFSLDIINLAEVLPKANSVWTISNQLVRCGTSVGANYRAVCRARSEKEFIAKMNIVLEEADEAGFWLEIIKEKEWAEVDSLLKEANELTAIFVAALRTINQRNK